MKALYDLKDKLQDELDEIARKPEMSAGDLETVHKLTDTIKNIDKICALEEDGGYSEAGDYEGGAYGRGSSYANRGKHYVRGHYSRDGRGGYSRDGALVVDSGTCNETVGSNVKAIVQTEVVDTFVCRKVVEY